MDLSCFSSFLWKIYEKKGTSKKAGPVFQVAKATTTTPARTSETIVNLIVVLCKTTT